MRLAVTADLHLPTTLATRIADLARQIDAWQPDAFVVAGDVAEGLGHLERCLAILTGLVSCPILVLAGNHDLWHHSARSRRLWEELLPETVERAGCTWLEGKAFVRNGVAVAGTIAWYDYSAADPSIQATPETFARQKGNFNADALMIDWEWSDPQFAERVAGPFLETLDRLEADPVIRQVVVVTHVPLLDCQMCRRPQDHDWSFSNAYFGNLTLGRQVLRRGKVTHILSGHTHVELHGQLHLDDGRVLEAHVLGSEYGRPVWLGLELPDKV